MSATDKLSLGLDDIIKSNGRNRRGGGNQGFRGRSGRGGGGGANGFRNRNVGGGDAGGGMFRASNASAGGGGRWKHDLFGGNSNRNQGGQRNSGVNSTTKLLISNLDFSVTTNDIQELFEDIGAVRTARVHYDESGRSLGTAEVIYERRVDAMNAVKKYNTLNLDGRPMDIRMVGDVGGASGPVSNRLSSANGGGGGGAGRNQRFGNRNNNQQNNSRGNGGRGGGRRQQQNGSNRKKEEVSAEDLDAELDAYRAESKQQKQAE